MEKYQEKEWFWILGGFKSEKNNWVWISQNIYGLQIANLQIRKLPHLRKVRKSLKTFGKSRNLRICDLGNLFAGRPPLGVR